MEAITERLCSHFPTMDFTFKNDYPPLLVVALESSVAELTGKLKELEARITAIEEGLRKNFPTLTWIFQTTPVMNSTETVTIPNASDSSERPNNTRSRAEHEGPSSNNAQASTVTVTEDGTPTTKKKFKYTKVTWD